MERKNASKEYTEKEVSELEKINGHEASQDSSLNNACMVGSARY